MNVHDFDWVARNVFAPVYPIVAEQIKDKTGVTAGLCLDLGCGGGYLGMALAGMTDLKVILLDRSEEMVRIARENVENAGLGDRIGTLSADVHHIPLWAGTVDLVASRGSVFFWEDKEAAFKEIRRVLAPGGRAYIGGGMGTPELMREIGKEMRAMNREFMQQRRGDRKKSDEFYRMALRNAGFERYTVRRDETGFWIEMGKGEEHD